MVRRLEAHRCGAGSALRRRRNGGDLCTGKAWHEQWREERSATVSGAVKGGGAVTYWRRARCGRDECDYDFSRSYQNGGEGTEASDWAVGTASRRPRLQTRERRRRGSNTGDAVKRCGAVGRHLYGAGTGVWQLPSGSFSHMTRWWRASSTTHATIKKRAATALWSGPPTMIASPWTVL
jgi:hypothetical protein